MIDQFTIARILDAAQIKDVVSDFVTLKQRGANFIGLCPFHNEKTPSFNVNPARGIFKCFGCGEGGNAVHFIMKHEQLSYVEALRFLAKKYNIEIVERELSADEQQQQSDRESMFALNGFAQKYFSNILHNHVDGRAVGLAYLRERGFSDAIIEKFQLGYCLAEQDAMTREALKNGFQKEFLQKTGLTYFGENGYMADSFRGRVIFPWHSLSGKVIAFGGRVLDVRTKGVNQKYKNSPESEIFKKGNELYGIYQAKSAIVRAKCVYMVEGYTDVISMHQCGVENVVANSGTALDVAQIRILHRLTSDITLLYDGDGAGVHAAMRGIDMLLAEGMNVKVVLLPDGEDPDGFARQHSAAEFVEFIAENQLDFIRFKANLLLRDAKNDPLKKAQAIGDVLTSISLIQNTIVTSEYIRLCSELFEKSETILYAELGKIKAKRNAEQRAAPSDELEVSTVAPTTPVDVDSVLDKAELAILKFVVQYGDTVVSVVEGKGDERCVHNMRIGEFVIEELRCDNLQFVNPLHEAFLTELEAHIADNGFQSSTFFASHPNPEISLLAADLLTEKYQLSQIFEKAQLQSVGANKKAEQQLSDTAKRRVDELEKQRREEWQAWLYDSVLSCLNDYKRIFISQRIKALERSLKDGSATDVAQVMRKHARLSEIKRKLAEALGQVILKH